MDIFKTAVVSLVIALGVSAVGFSIQKPVVPVQEPVKAGAVSSPDLASPYISWGGVREWAASTAFASATSTACSIQSPAATSTLISATAHLTASVGFSSTWLFGYSSTKNATTTALGSALAIANPDLTGTIVATTTNIVLAPNTWVSFNLSTTTASSLFAPQGYCYVKFREL